MSDLSQVNAIVTGSTRGLGLSIARSLLANGARVVVNGRDETACRAAVEDLGYSRDQLGYVVGRVDVESTADALVATCEAQFGPVGLVVNNAGVTRDRSLINMTVDEFDEVVAVHLRGTWLMCRAAARSMQSTGGKILNITSGSALFGLVGQSNYAAAKGGVNALTRALSVELARYQIAVNALYPIAHTDMTAPVLAMTGGEASPLHSIFDDPDHVAKVVAGLADSSCPPITGQIIGFDGSEFALWTHPDRDLIVRHEAPWTDAQVRTMLEQVSAAPAPLNPDHVGSATREALRQHRSR